MLPGEVGAEEDETIICRCVGEAGGRLLPNEGKFKGDIKARLAPRRGVKASGLMGRLLLFDAELDPQSRNVDVVIVVVFVNEVVTGGLLLLLLLSMSKTGTRGLLLLPPPLKGVELLSAAGLFASTKARRR